MVASWLGRRARLGVQIHEGVAARKWRLTKPWEASEEDASSCHAPKLPWMSAVYESLGLRVLRVIEELLKDRHLA